MKRSIEALVAALVLAVASSAAQAVAPVVKIKADASLSRFSTAGGGLSTAAKLHVNTSFSTDTPGAPPFTIQKAVIYLPDHAGTNGRLFPSCSAAQIERFHGNVGRCPKGSRLGSGTVKARALQLGITAGGRVAVFNGPHGKTITFNIQTVIPAAINESLDAPLTTQHGIYGEKFTLVVPPSLQEIISGVFVGVQRFDVTLSANTRVHGVDYSYFRARTCPKRAIHGVFDFKDWTTGQTATATADTKVHCRAG